MTLIKQPAKINVRLGSIEQFDRLEERYVRLAIGSKENEGVLGAALVLSDPSSQSGFQNIAVNVRDLVDALKEIGYVDANLGKHISVTQGV